MSAMPEGFALTPEERHSALWLRLEKLLAERLDSHRRKNDTAIPPDQTAALRGQITEVKALRKLLAMDFDPSPAKVADAPMGPQPGETG